MSGPCWKVWCIDYIYLVNHTNKLIKWVIIDSSDGVSPNLRKAITWCNVDSYGPLGANFGQLWSKFFIQNMHLKKWSAKWQPFCCDLNVRSGLWWAVYRYVINEKQNTGVVVRFGYIAMIVMASQSPATPHFVQQYGQAYIKGNIKDLRHWPFVTGHRIPLTPVGQWRGKCFHVITSHENKIRSDLVENQLQNWYLYMYMAISFKFGSTNDKSSSGGRKWKHIFDHQGGGQNLPKTQRKLLKWLFFRLTCIYIYTYTHTRYSNCSTHRITIFNPILNC